MAKRGNALKNRELTPDMVAAALELYSYLGQWRDSEEALRSLTATMPSHTQLDQVLIKVTTVNGLYGTNVYALVRMAHHIADVMERRGRAPISEDLVEELAYLGPERGRPEHRHTSFASKYAHFFIDEVTFPIYDNLAARMIRWHLGLPMDSEGKEEKPYLSFLGNLRELRRRYLLDHSNHDLDLYLWLSGLWWYWNPSRRWKRNAEAGDLFRSPTGSQQELLNRLFPHRRQSSP